jgi:predicted DCC family thiol-disulfide oxidoreductase YuxK
MATPTHQRIDNSLSDSARAWPILYDEDCCFCKWSLDKLLAWDRSELLRPVSIQSGEGQVLLADIPEDKRLDSFHLISPEGEIRSAGAACEPLARLLPGGTPLAVIFRTFPGLTEGAYRLVASNRNRLARLLRIDATCTLGR